MKEILMNCFKLGVHLKALDTYRQVFNILGHPGHGHYQNLARSLFLYAIGLFPVTFIANFRKH